MDERWVSRTASGDCASSAIASESITPSAAAGPYASRILDERKQNCGL